VIRYKTILLVAAVKQELFPFLEGYRAESSASRDNNGTKVEALITGMGREVASRALNKVLSRGDVCLVVSAGFAGGTRPGFQVGDLVVASEVVDAASRQRHQPERSLFGLNGVASVGPLVTEQALVSDSKTKEALGAKYGAIAVDLETAAVAEAAERHKIPWVSVRTILDPMEMAVPVSSWLQALKLAAQPARWNDFSALMGAIRVSAQALAAGLKVVVEQAEKDQQQAPHSVST